MNAAVAIDDLAYRKERQKFLGGSDIAAMLGIAPPTWSRNSPLSLYLDKIEPPAPESERKSSGVKRRGKRWEAVVAEMLVEKLQELGHTVEIVRSNTRYLDPDVPYFACEIDFEIRLDGEQEITNVELKTVHPYKTAEWGEEGTDESPVWYTAQVMWGLGITRRTRSIIAPLFGADEIRIYQLPAANDVIHGVRQAADEFWNKHVVPRVPPSPVSLIDLARLFPRDVGRTIDVTEENVAVLDALAELRAADRDYDAVEARWEAAELIVKDFMGDAAALTVGGKKACSWKAHPETRIDVTRLRDVIPNIAALFERTSDVRKFLLSRGKKS